MFTYSIVVVIGAQNKFVGLVKFYYYSTVVYKARLNTKFKCVSVTKYTLVMSPFSHNFIKTKIDYNYNHCFNSHSAWFLDGRTSIHVFTVKTGHISA